MRLVILDARIDVCRCLDVVDECKLVNECSPGVFADFVGKDGVGYHFSPIASATTRAASSGEEQSQNAERRAILVSKNSHVIKVQAGSSNDPFISLHSLCNVFNNVDYCAHT